MSSETGISIVTTVKDEERHIGAFLDSVSCQSPPFEIVIVDSESKDGTGDILRSRSKDLDMQYILRRCSRGEGRNIGVSAAKYDYILFLDGDCEFSGNLLDSYRKLIQEGYDIIGGVTELSGDLRFSGLERVKLFLNGFEVTTPSSNLCYRRSLFEKLGGFNPILVTAEDIDLNIRAIRFGSKYALCSDCVVRSFTRDNTYQFIRQAFWNGYGRGQLRMLSRKHWADIKKGPRFSRKLTFENLLRLSMGFSGYIYAFMRNGKYPFH